MTTTNNENIEPVGNEKPEKTGQAQTPAQEQTPTKSANSEAARYRVKLREAEAERDALAASLAQARDASLKERALALTLSNSRWVQPEAFKELNLDSSEFFAEGHLDETKLTQELEAQLEARPYLFAEPERTVIPIEGEKQAVEMSPGFVDMFKKHFD